MHLYLDCPPVVGRPGLNSRSSHTKRSKNIT